MRTPVAIEAAKAIMAEVPDAVVGIGTILNARRSCARQGARRQVRHQPRPDARTAAGRRRKRLAVCAGHRHRLRTDAGAGVRLRRGKILPGRAGRRYQGAALAGGPFPNVRFCPTGGIGEANAATWLAEPNVVAVGGSWLCPAAEIRAGNWAGITAICHRALKALKPA